MNRTLRGIWALTVALPLALTACSSSDENQCEDFCGEGAACVGGRCSAVPACAPACGASEACQDGACVATLASACGGSCSGDQVCVTSGGAAACVSACGAGEAWNSTTGACQAMAEYCGAGQTWDAVALACKLTNLHAAYFDGKALANGPAVTAECIKCHQADALQMAGSAHFTWLGPTPDLLGKETETAAVGKKNLINNFCIAVASNEPRCTQCHAGYGDAANKVPGYELTGEAALGRVDCLICHADMATGYTKAAPTWGSADVASTATGCTPACTASQACVNQGSAPACVEKTVQLPKMLVAAAKSVGTPGRANCGFCHFAAGGGDNVKMGDLGSALKAPAGHADVHMGSTATGGNGMSCVDCHVTQQHRIFGAGVSVAVTEGRTSCTDCHDTAAAAFAAISSHRASHLAAMACQTCHIPAFSRQLPTKMRWDWSTAGIKDRTVSQTTHTTASGVATTTKDYDWMKGDFVWAADVAPAYRWYDGKGMHLTVNDSFAQAGTEADPVIIAAPTATASSTGAKITPFKQMSGKQAAMADGSFLLVPHLFGPGGFWDAAVIPATGQTLESVRPIWTGVLTNGARKAGQIAADATLGDGDWEWVESRMYMNINHEVAPKAQAIGKGGCTDCHGATPKIPFCEIYGAAASTKVWGVTCPTP